MRFRARLITTGLTGLLVAATAMLTTAGPALATVRAPQVNASWTETQGIHKTSKAYFSGDWVRCNYVTVATYKQSPNCSKGKTVALTISETFGYSGEEISASVGFSVTYSSTVTAGNAITVDPGGYGWFDVGYRLHGYTIEMQKRTCHTVGGCSAWGDSHTITVQKYLGPTYHYFGSGAES